MTKAAQMVFNRMKEVEKGLIRAATQGAQDWMFHSYKREFEVKSPEDNAEDSWKALMFMVHDEFDQGSKTNAFPRGCPQ